MSIVINTDAKELTKDFKDLNPRLQRMVYLATFEALLKSEKQMMSHTPIDTGLLASGYETVASNEEEILFGNTTPYAMEVEKGRPPGAYSSDQKEAILEWSARQKGLPANHEESKGFAEAVIHKHEKYGRAPTHFFENGVNDIVIPFTRAAVERTLDQATNSDYEKAKNKNLPKG